MLTERFKRELNKNDYYVVDPKSGKEKSLDTDRIVDMAKKALKKVVIASLVVGSLGTGALGYLFADEIADYKEEKAYNKAIITMDKEYRDTHENISDDSICALLEDQGCCYTAYPDKNLQFILEGISGKPIVKKCDNEECSICEKNREIEDKVNDIVREDERFTEVVEEHIHNQHMENVRGK